MIEFAQSHVDLMGSLIYTEAQLSRKWQRELARRYSKDTQENLRDFNQVKDLLPDGHPRKTGETATLVNNFIADRFDLMDRLDADLAKNTLLIAALAYELAAIQLPRLQVRITGQDYIAPTEAVSDPETLEVTTPFDAGQREVIAVPALVDSVDEGGEAIEIDNPLLLEIQAKIDQFEILMFEASTEVKDLVEERAIDQTV
jgi:hypothetical protein